MTVGLTVTKIVIIESLDDHDTPTHWIINEYVRNELLTSRVRLPIQLIRCENFLDFKATLAELSAEARETGSIPLLHVEIHGDPVEGLIFSNGSSLSWVSLAEALVDLNLATRFNLLAVFSACFGAHFIEQMAVITKSPCWALIAPTEQLDPSEIIACFRRFYRVLFRQLDIGPALYSMKSTPLLNGHWLGISAESWFEQIVIGYVTSYCTKDAVRKRAKDMLQQGEETRIPRSIGNARRLLQQQNRKSLTRIYFERYFMTEQIPENTERYKNFRKRLDRKIDNLRKTNRYEI